MRDRYLVIGLGRFGSALAASLAEEGKEVIAADRDMTAVERVKGSVSLAVQLDASDPIGLESIEASRCSVAIVAMGEDFEGSVLTVTSLKELGIRHIVARARTPREGRVLSAVGAHEVVFIESEMGKTVAARLAVFQPPPSQKGA